MIFFFCCYVFFLSRKKCEYAYIYTILMHFNCMKNWKNGICIKTLQFLCVFLILFLYKLSNSSLYWKIQILVFNTFAYASFAVACLYARQWPFIIHFSDCARFNADFCIKIRESWLLVKFFSLMRKYAIQNLFPSVIQYVLL